MVTYLSIYRHKDPPRSKSGYRGVIFCPHLTKNPWKAYVRDSRNRSYKTLGYFPTKEEAALAYNAVAVRYHGPDTYLNPVKPKQDPKHLLEEGLRVVRSARA
jgi:hypothetical protein